jgi:mono/diheme cytochrome c family protein
VSHQKQIALTIGIAPFALILLAAGCKKDAEAPASTGGTGGSSSAQASSGEAVFRSNGCARCHVLGGQGGRMGPDLSHVGADPQHTTEWIAQHIKNPKSHNPGSRMPAFEGKIPDKDLQALAAYLASLK